MHSVLEGLASLGPQRLTQAPNGPLVGRWHSRGVEGAAGSFWGLGDAAVDASQGFRVTTKHKVLPSTWEVTSEVGQRSSFQTVRKVQAAKWPVPGWPQEPKRWPLSGYSSAVGTVLGISLPWAASVGGSRTRR